MDLRASLWIAVFLLLFLLVGARSRRRREPVPWIYLLFFCSGFPALIYQIVWQRALFAIYGVNVESVTIVVSAFMFGLGLGSLAGGALSKSSRLPLLPLFAIAELGTAAFGLVSLRLFHWVAEFTAGSPPIQTGIVSFGLVVVPTVLMGATLPLLVEHIVRTSRNVGFAVGGLYFVNTLGSAAACFVAGDVLMRLRGLSGSVKVAVTINALVGGAVLLYGFFAKRDSPETASAPAPVGSSGNDQSERLLPFPLALACSTFAGFLALSYEIVWYRILAFASAGLARVFAFLLGSYLLGIAMGSRLVERYSQQRGRDRTRSLYLLGWILLASAIVSFSVGPLFAYILHFSSSYTLGGSTLEAYWAFLPLIGLGALLFGATFPLISHASVAPDDSAGQRLSYLYAANIVGSTLGSFIVGFLLMNFLSLGEISLVLMVSGIVVASGVLLIAKLPQARLRTALAIGVVTACVVAAASQPVFRTLYDRLQFKKGYPRLRFREVVESRSGAVGVTPDGTVYGGGVYDGRFNVNLMHDVNMIARAYALSAFRPQPRRVLMVGLASGSWAQVVAANPEVEDLTIVEINPAYLQLIPEHSDVASLLGNPKVHLVIDDGRRWMLHNHEARFDAIVMNTTFYWRDHASSLLSTDFLKIARQHLNADGVLFYNATGSDDVLATGLTVFPYALRFMNCLAVSDSPVTLDREHWKKVLLSYQLNGRPVVDVHDRTQVKFVEKLLEIPADPTGQKILSIEENDQLRQRLRNLSIVTDDNMGAEWR